MSFYSVQPILYTLEFEATIEFYTSNLGFTVGNIDIDQSWAALQKDSTGIMIAKPNAHQPFEKPIFTGSFYFKVSNVDELWDQLQDVVSICYAIETFEWQMREFAIFDNNGYVLQFGQEVG